MISISGYQILSQLTETSSSLIYRAIRMNDDLPVVIKTPKGDLADAKTLAQLHHAFAVAGDIDIPGIIKHYALEKSQNRIALVMEDFSQTTLRQIIKSGQLDFQKCLAIGIQLANILDELHRLKIIHKDIKPSNILVHPETNTVKLIDFGISTRLSMEKTYYSTPRMVEGSLEYISPEQTGRMNRPVDYRTDYYSFGITLYQMFTQRLPFTAKDDPIAIVHAHIARQAIPPNQIQKDIPKSISNIIMKLISKNAEDRYQTAHGIEADFLECQKQLNANGQISDFKIGQLDISNTFNIPQKLYGRESEIDDLLNAFERINRPTPTTPSDKTSSFVAGSYGYQSSKTEMILVAGYSGIGKSVLVQEIHKSIVSLRGYYTWGKFDQFKRDIPYIAIIQAFSELVRQILTETNVELDTWRTELLEALGPNGQVIIDVIPALENIIGPQPEVPELAPIESQNRFNFVFRKFIRVFASQNHPLVIFLDDLQWADSGSLKLMHTFITDPDTSHLLLIGAYRDNEVNTGHPLMLTLDDIRRAGTSVNTILLKPLDLHHINQLIVDTLNVETASARPLAELIYSKTYGNPFFVNQFLTMLHTEGLLEFISPDQSDSWGWRWDFAHIQELSITDNVVDLMVSKLQKLSDDTLKAIKLAACYGNRFDLEGLSIINETPPKETAHSLWEAVKKGLVYPLSDLRLTMLLTHYDTMSEDSTTEGPDSKIYQFLHDRVQQAAYSMIPEDEKPGVHLKIGRLLLKRIPESEREDNIFDIVNHLNTGIHLIQSQTEKNELARLNLIGGKKAKNATAYQSAFSYLKTGISLLIDECWEKDYELILNLYIEATETAFLSGDFKEMDRLSQVVLDKATQLLDKVTVYEVIIQSKTARNQMLEALDTALSVLALLGIKLSKHPNKFQIIKALMKTKALMSGKDIEDLKDLPEMTDPNKLAAMQILSHVNTAAYVAIPELLAVSVFQQVILSIKFGNAALSAYAYASYGAILCGVVGDIDTGYKFAQLGVKLAEYPKSRKYKSRTLMVANSLVLHWKDSSRKLLPQLLTSYQSGLETGDLEYAALALFMYNLQSYLNGRKLDDIEQEMARYSQIIKGLNQETTYNYNRMYHQATLNLLSETTEPGRLQGDSYDEKSMLKVHQKANDRTAFEMLFYHKLILNFHYQKFHPAVECSIISEKDVDAAMGVFAVPAFYFYDSLARLAICQVSGKVQKMRHRLKVAKNQRKMKKWARFSPSNHYHKYVLVEAERARIRGKLSKAMEYYDTAIKAAQKNEYIQEQGLANELAARFYLSLGRETVARTYMLNARKCYHQWGAIGKINDLDNRYSNLFSGDDITQESKLSNDTQDTVLASSISTGFEELDLASVMKASQAISGEIVLSRLMEKLMEIVIENAGAQKGYLILDTSTVNFQIEGEPHKSSNLYICESDTFTPLEKSSDVSQAIINYVIRNNESVVLNDAVSEGNFMHDSYVVRNQPKSILCMPIMRHYEISGILYLENKETSGAFTAERVQVLQILAAQAAISIENATLYANMEKQAAYIENIIKFMLDTLIVVDLNGIIMTVNRAMLDLTGYTHDELHGKHVEILLSDEEKEIEIEIPDEPESHTELPGVFAKLIHQKAITNYEMLFKTKKNDLIPVNFSGSVMTDKHHSEICIVAIARDMRELRNVMAQLIQAEKLTALGELTAGVAHELKQPLNVIKIIGQSIVRDIEKDRLDSEYLDKDLRDIILQVNKMAEIIDHMRVFTRFSGEMQKMEVHVNELMDSMFKLFSQQLKNHNVDLRKELADDIPYIMGDQIRIEQVLMNLVTNARHAVEKSVQEQKFIEVKTYELPAKESPLREKTVVVQVKDNGGGIPENLEDKIFEQFFTTRSSGEGTGLGLSISKKIIEEHQGKILLENEPGFGATFKVFLPCVQ
ncbi:multi-sensor signal transduction multi-kinase [Candidatus Magnetomorum sp. HK-1]|nr:multi-sensor signal transduction multi-kinase [Candidatus Magnetomorum sp. HK-1]